MDRELEVSILSLENRLKRTYRSLADFGLFSAPSNLVFDKEGNLIERIHFSSLPEKKIESFILNFFPVSN